MNKAVIFDGFSIFSPLFTPSLELKYQTLLLLSPEYFDIQENLFQTGNINEEMRQH
ncbi:hypothetical protein [Veronia pacifica]|uniref:hypothetical protein n=1 Tax=Veronia pacifica TaxID=1080227 RepID=UPI0015860008|nr:hypothetical protein [Veronia pacifica]